MLRISFVFDSRFIMSDVGKKPVARLASVKFKITNSKIITNWQSSILNYYQPPDNAVPNIINRLIAIKKTTVEIAYNGQL